MNQELGQVKGFPDVGRAIDVAKMRYALLTPKGQPATS